jgi:hypothetical protein
MTEFHYDLVLLGLVITTAVLGFLLRRTGVTAYRYALMGVSLLRVYAARARDRLRARTNQ